MNQAFCQNNVTDSAGIQVDHWSGLFYEASTVFLVTTNKGIVHAHVNHHQQLFEGIIT